jgi:hypothetical protein
VLAFSNGKVSLGFSVMRCSSSTWDFRLSEAGVGGECSSKGFRLTEFGVGGSV